MTKKKREKAVREEEEKT